MSTTYELQMADGADWHFVNGDWVDGDNGVLAVSDKDIDRDDIAPQCVHLAFYHPLWCADFSADFVIRLGSHTDTGLIFRARDPEHFYLLHFPNCGQASRAQHFWAAFSRMDGNGCLKIIKLALVNRVSSTNGITLPVSVTVKGNRIDCRIGDYGRFEVEDAACTGPGRIGVYSFNRGGALPELARLRISAESAPAADRPADRSPTRNWWQPLPDVAGWQMPYDLRRFDDGELLLQFNLQTRRDCGEQAAAQTYLTRSTDQGRTWSAPEAFGPAVDRELAAWSGLRIHITPAGRLIGFAPDKDSKKVWESVDRGRTWTEAPNMNLHLGPPREQPVQDLSPNGLTNLRDGTILAPVLARVDTSDQSESIFTWGGGTHCQAWCLRSEDDGRTWSEPVNLDNQGLDADGNQIPGNMDLTEPSLVQLGSGRVLALIRPVYSPWMWETWSDDGGRTWGQCVRGPFPGYAPPNMVRTASGALLIAHRLPGLTVNCSLDDGLTWDAGTMIDTGLWAMGSMVEVEPDLVLYVYWDSCEGPMRAQYLRVTPAGLEPVRPR